MAVCLVGERISAGREMDSGWTRKWTKIGETERDYVYDNPGRLVDCELGMVSMAIGLFKLGCWNWIGGGNGHCMNWVELGQYGDGMQTSSHCCKISRGGPCEVRNKKERSENRRKH